MFTTEGKSEFDKWKEWISDEDFAFSPNFVPDENTPQGAIDYYKSVMSMVVDFNDPNFKWPTGIGLNC